MTTTSQDTASGRDPGREGRDTLLRVDGLRKVYDGLRHELHNELAGHQVLADEVDWIRDRVSRMHMPAGGASAA